ncbi:hypothetical protein Agabi119p4_1103 [Agaricus bisporus var. burnettii]|uniref:Uncharacterized protein n=1 Tax=Agaricus bisporus var. burnettii TaxID=192524 RepID=A0A8H7FCC0_AGABI|nr:hypothetical protein Agabi119p4_1103 [Agaricus bisporus var. burnettii]
MPARRLTYYSRRPYHPRREYVDESPFIDPPHEGSDPDFPPVLCGSLPPLFPGPSGTNLGTEPAVQDQNQHVPLASRSSLAAVRATATDPDFPTDPGSPPDPDFPPARRGSLPPLFPGPSGAHSNAEPAAQDQHNRSQHVPTAPRSLLAVTRAAANSANSVVSKQVPAIEQGHSKKRAVAAANQGCTKKRASSRGGRQLLVAEKNKHSLLHSIRRKHGKRVG